MASDIVPRLHVRTGRNVVRKEVERMSFSCCGAKMKTTRCDRPSVHSSPDQHSVCPHLEIVTCCLCAHPVPNQKENMFFHEYVLGACTVSSCLSPTYCGRAVSSLWHRPLQPALRHPREGCPSFCAGWSSCTLSPCRFCFSSEAP